MAKCLAIFEGTSVKLKTLVARSAVMFVLKNVIKELNLLYWSISLHCDGHQWRLFIDKSCEWGTFFWISTKVLKSRTMNKLTGNLTKWHIPMFAIIVTSELSPHFLQKCYFLFKSHEPIFGSSELLFTHNFGVVFLQ